MKFIKRLVFVLILLLVAFFIYRMISPAAAKNLLYDLKSFSNNTIGTHFSLSGTTLLVTWTVIDITGTILQDTWGLQEITGDDELLLRDITLSQENLDTGNDISWTTISGDALLDSPILSWTTTIIVSPPTTVIVPKKTPPPKNNNDLDHFLQNFGN